MKEIRKLPTPIRVKILAKLLKGYPDSDYICDGFRHGFMLDFQGSEAPLSSDNSWSAVSQPEVVDDKLSQEAEKGRIAGPFSEAPFKNFKASPLALRPKPESGKFRLLHNLSYPYDLNSVNANIPKEATHVQYSSIKDAIYRIQELGAKSYLAKADIADAFRLIPLHPSQYHLTGFYWKGYWYDMCLPMGCSQSCKIFERFSDAIQWILLKEFNIKTIKLLDDFLFVENSKELCQKALSTFKWICEQVGIPIAEKKTAGPSNSLVFLGIELDTVAMQARLPGDKLSLYKEEIVNTLEKNKITLRELQSVIGRLQFATSVVSGGRPFLRRLYDLTIKVSKPHYKINLNQAAKEDLQIWLRFLDIYNGVSLITPHYKADSASLHLYSDASKYGYGVTFGKAWFQGTWSPRWQQFDITVLELYPIYMAMAIFGESLAHHKVVFHCDNQAIVAILNKQTSKSKPIMNIVRPLVCILLSHDILFKAQHIPGVSNDLCDMLSRQVATPDKLARYGMRPSPISIPDHILPDNFIPH